MSIFENIANRSTSGLNCSFLYETGIRKSVDDYNSDSFLVYFDFFLTRLYPLAF